MARDLVSLKLFTLSLTTALVGLLVSSCSINSTKDSSTRIPDHPIVPLITARRSLYDLYRTRTNDQIKAILPQLFEAARWAPSEYNAQPWRFIYALPGTEAWDTLFATLAPGNQQWVAHASAMILVLSATQDAKGRSLSTHSFDTGLAVSQLLLQATELGLITHPLAGFDHEQVRKAFEIPLLYTIEVLIALGEQASHEHSNKSFAKRDARTATRKSINEFAFEGKLG